VSRAGDLPRFVAIAATIEALAALAVGLLARPHGGRALAFALTGWGIMAAVGIVAGAFLVRAHGRPGSGFLAALAAGMLGRLFLAAVGCGWAALQDIGAVWSFLGGLLAGYAPLQAFELTWFVRRSRRS